MGDIDRFFNHIKYDLDSVKNGCLHNRLWHFYAARLIFYDFKCNFSIDKNVEEQNEFFELIDGNGFKVIKECEGVYFKVLKVILFDG